MNTSSAQDVLAEVWAIKDSLSASHGHSLKATCRAMYAEQQKHPGDFVNLGVTPMQNKTLETAGGASKSPVARKRRLRPARVSA
ncbi:MAG: hypothetical protein ACOYOF_20955 [Verrucomicrobiaceae bacterium]